MSERVDHRASDQEGDETLAGGAAASSIASADTEAGLGIGPLRTGAKHVLDAGFTFEGELIAARARDGLFGGTSAAIQVGRYVLLDRLGAGGMGVVFAAYDAMLDRKVAIKFIHADLADSEITRERFLREARAMARLSHPNVVQIYEAGESDGRIFIALEFIAGSTLREYLAEHGDALAWRDKLALFRSVGEGLAAAHAAAVVHRDFKPDNVLRTKDGVLKVADFGLAGLVATETTARTGSGDTFVTQRGSVLGTPRYMSPEQHSGAPTDARCDQFAFCVALFEALYGTGPFAGDSTLELAVAVLENRRREVAAHGVPRRVREVIDRGLAVDPSARWPDMRTLLDALDRTTRSRSLAVWIGGTIAIAAFAVWPSAASPDPAVDPCAHAGDEANALRGVATTATAAWASEWAAARREGCNAHQGGMISAPLFDRRQLCLDAALAAEHARIELFWNATITAAPPPDSEMLARCTDAVRLTEGAITPAPDRAQWIARRESLARAEALVDAGVLEPAAAIVSTLDTSGDVEAGAAAGWLRGRIHRGNGEHDAALAMLTTAAALADEARDDDLRARALVESVWVLGVELYRGDEARRVATQARGTFVRASVPESVTAQLDEALGMTAMYEGHLDTAATLLESALAKTQGPEARAVLHANLASVQLRRGDAAAAVTQFERALAVLEAEHGPDHETVAQALNNLGVALTSAGRHADSLAIHRRSLALRERIYGPDAIETANALGGVGIALVETGDATPARVVLERALAIRETAGGRPEDLAEVQFALARALATTDSERAHALASAALAAYRSPELAASFARESAAVSAWLSTPTPPR